MKNALLLLAAPVPGDPAPRHALPDGMESAPWDAFWVDQCRDVQRESWSDSMVTFSCIPSYEVGIKKGVVKPYSGAPVQYTFEVDVENPD